MILGTVLVLVGASARDAPVKVQLPLRTSLASERRLEGTHSSAAGNALPPSHSQQSTIPAFPGAEGYGAGALGACNRGSVDVIAVTNLNDSGPGSLRQALAEAESATSENLKVIVFRVSGYIELSSRVDFRGRCLYLAGQTAPGDGVTIKRSGLRFRDNASDIVIRYLRFRLGYYGDNNGQTPILVTKGENYILDHISLSWSTGILVRFSSSDAAGSGPISNVTVQRSLFGEPFINHPTGLMFGGSPKTDTDDSDAGWRTMTRYTAHHNLFASVSHRNPNMKGASGESINNLIHNWNLDGGQTGREVFVDFVNNYVQKGPLSKKTYYPIAFNRDNVLSEPYYRPSIYAVGNLSLGGGHYSDQNTDPDADNWTGPSRVVGWYRNDPDNTEYNDFRRDARLDRIIPPAIFPVTVQTARTARDDVLGDVGANARLDCLGRWIPHSDPVDLRLLKEVKNRSGVNVIPHDETDVGGFPVLTEAPACPDSDDDGMPDLWERSVGLNPEDPADAGTIVPSGYSQLEMFLNGMN